MHVLTDVHNLPLNVTFGWPAWKSFKA